MFQHDTVVQRYSARGITYDGAATHPAMYRHSEEMPSSSNELALALQFEAPLAPKYGDVFQTAPVNKGLRMELSSPSQLAVIAAAHNGAGFIPYIITKTFVFRKWHTFALTITREKHIVARFDGHAIVDEADPDLDYALSDIVIGTGVNEMRPFNGRIRDGSITYVLYQHSGNAYLNGFRAFCILAALVLFVLWGRSYGR